MARRVSDTFKAGMITDVIGAEGSVYELSDMYVRRSGELACRGPIRTDWATATNIGYHCGWSQAQFHPNMGVAASRGVASASAVSGRRIDLASKYQLMCAPLQAVPSSSTGITELDFNLMTEGSDYAQVPLHAGVTATVSAATGLPFEKTIQMTNAGEEIVMAGEIGSLYKWGGSLYAPYGTGTVSIASASASASRIVTGSGTSWSTTVQEGQYILMNGIAEKANTFQRAYRITKVVDNTHLEIELPIYATAGYSGIAYRIQSVAVIQSPDGVWNGTDERPRQVGVVTYHQGKIFTAGVSDNRSAYNTVYDFDSIRWSGTLDENSNGFSHLDLWHNNARISVFPGIGGSIRGLVSMGNELVVVKSHGLFRVTGSSTYDGTGAGMAIQVISIDVGAAGFNAWTLTSRGLVIACRDGLYLYDGESVQSLTDGRVKRWWEANFQYGEFAVTQYEDKVIVMPVGQAQTSRRLVWDAEQNLFWTIASNMYEFAAGISTYSSNDEWIGDYAFEGGLIWPVVDPGPQHAVYSDNTLVYTEISHLNHKRGFTATCAEDVGVTTALSADTNGAYYPKPAVITQPFALGEDAVSEGRINNVFVHAAIAETVAYPATSFNNEIGIYILSGNSHVGITDAYSAGEYFGTDQVLEYGIEQIFGTVAAQSDRIHRIPVDGMTPAPSARILIDSTWSHPTTGPAFDDIGWGMRIYAIGIDYEPSEIQGPGITTSGGV